MKRALGVFVISTLLVTVCCAFLLLTNTGLRLLVRVSLPQSMEIGEVYGRAIGRVRLHDVRLEQPGILARAAQIDFGWDLIDGLAAGLRLKRLEIESLEITLAETDVPPSDSGMIKPRELSIPDAKVHGLLVSVGGSEWRADELVLAVTTGPDAIVIERLVLDAGGFDLSAAGRLDLPAREGIIQPSWQLTVNVPEFEPSAVNDAWPATRLGSRLELDGMGTRLNINGALWVPEWTARTIMLDGSFDWADDGLQIEALEIDLDDAPTRVVLAGWVGWAPNLDYDLQGEWEAIAWSIPGVAGLQSPEGQFDVAGSLSEYSGSLVGRLRGPAAGGRSIEGEIVSRVTGDASHAVLEAVSIRVADGWIGGTASIDWHERPLFVAELRAVRFDPGLVLNEFSGGVDYDLTVQAEWMDKRRRYVMILESLAGDVNGRPVTGSARVESVDTESATTSIDLRFGDGSIFATGRIGAELDLTWRLDAPDLTAFLPGVSGQLRSEGRVAGSRAEPRFELSAQGAGLKWLQLGVGKLDTRIRFDIATSELGVTRTTLEDVRWRGLELERVDTSIEGKVSSHQLVGVLTAADGVAQFRGEGGYQQQQWTGRFTSLTSDSDLIGRWELEAPVAVEVVAGGFSADRACFGDPPARLCAAGALSKQQTWWVEADLDGIDLPRLAPLLPPDFDYVGQLTAKCELRGGPDLPLAGTATVNLDSASLAAAGQDDAIATLNSGTARFSAGRDDIALDMELDLTPQGELEARLRAGRADADAQVEGHVRGSVSGLQFLTLLFPELLDVTGELVVDVDVGGTAAAPTYTGNVSLIDGTASVVAAGISLEDIGLTIDGDKTAVNVLGSARSGDGQVRFSGSTSWLDGQTRGNFVLAGERFRFFGLPGARADASTDLELTMLGRDLDLTGEVHIDSARIEAVDQTRAVDVSPDEVIIGRTPPDPERWRVSSRVSVTLGEDITVDAYGIKGSIRGALEIIDVPGKPAAGTGQLAIVDGFFKAYGQSFDIERGRLSFGGGPLSNPALDVRAERQYETMLAGVEVRGTIREPQISVFSDPPRPRQDVVSMLVMGAAPAELGRASDTLAYGNTSAQLDQLRWRLSRKWMIEINRGFETSAGIIYLAR